MNVWVQSSKINNRIENDIEISGNKKQKLWYINQDKNVAYIIMRYFSFVSFIF